MMKTPAPIIVADLFPEILDQLLELLSNLPPEDWDRPTACALWSVKDIASHLLGDDVGILSRKRDLYALSDKSISGWDDLVALINDLNATWVQATRRISPRLLCDLLRFTGEQVCAYLYSVDPYALGGPVSWAGPDPAPVWLDLAREYTERWLHQQHIRDAVSQPGLKEPRYLAPVLDTFVRALPHTYRAVQARDGTLIALTISGNAGGKWLLLRENGAWHLGLDCSQSPHAEVILCQDVAWRLFSKGVAPNRVQATILGDRQLGAAILDMVSVIA